MPFHCYLAKKLAITQDQKDYIKCLSWSNSENHDGYISAGMNSGKIELVRMNSDPDQNNPLQRGLAAPSQPLKYKGTLTEHLKSNNKKQIMHCLWNRTFNKLTTSDSTGYTIVFTPEEQKQAFLETFNNQDNKSSLPVNDISWSSDGTKICIIYAKSNTIVGTVDGKRIMALDDPSLKLSKCCFGDDKGECLLLGSNTGEVRVHDANSGDYIKRVKVICVEYTQSNCNLVCIRRGKKASVDSHTLAIVYSTGHFQLMKDLEDQEPICFECDFVPEDLQFSPNGKYAVLTGLNQIQIFSTENGNFLKALSVTKPSIGKISLTFGKNSQRMAISSDKTVFFANLRPDYLFGTVKDTLIYACNTTNTETSSLVFWNLATSEHFVKQVKNLTTLATDGMNLTCAIAKLSPTRSIAVMCNSIGVVLSQQRTEFVTTMASIGNNFVMLASQEKCLFWFQDDLKSKNNINVSTEGRVISSIAANQNTAVIAFQDTLQFYQLPEGSKKFSIDVSETIVKLKFNSDSTLLGAITKSGSFCVFGLRRMEKIEHIDTKLISTWDFEFGSDNPTTVVIIDKGSRNSSNWRIEICVK